MATYIIGDVHGCYQAVLNLLDKIDFDSAVDKLVFVGDLVGKGPASKQVVQFVVEHDCVQYVLGNHDLFAMALAYGCYPDIDHPYQIILDQDQKLLDQWRLKSQLMILDESLHYAVIHAGLLPKWSILQAKQFADEVVRFLHGDSFKLLLSHIEGDEPLCWDESLFGMARYRFIINAMTRMRFCDANSCLDFREKDKIVSDFSHLKAWFDWPLALNDCRLFFGHWAVLNGNHTAENIYATDTGCVYGGELTCYQIKGGNQSPVKISI